MRVGAYLLAADPTWVRSTLVRYYDRLDALVVAAAQDNRGWTGHPIAVDEALAAVRDVDRRGIAREVRSVWRYKSDPMAGETAQRTAALRLLDGEVDWVLQLDGDELLTDVDTLIETLESAGDAVAVEWPMRVLYRRLGDGRYLQVVDADGSPRYEYPGPIAVRAGTQLSLARRTKGPFVRLMVETDHHSAEAQREAEPGEERRRILTDRQAIVHNSWARTPREVHRKVSTWSHNAGLRSQVYYFGTWLPAPLRWRRMRDFHPMHGGLWPRLEPYELDESLLDPADR